MGNLEVRQGLLGQNRRQTFHQQRFHPRRSRSQKSHLGITHPDG